jgi:hypothetical protein
MRKIFDLGSFQNVLEDLMFVVDEPELVAAVRSQGLRSKKRFGDVRWEARANTETAEQEVEQPGLFVKLALVNISSTLQVLALTYCSWEATRMD